MEVFFVRFEARGEKRSLYLVCRIIKAIFSVVIAEAAIIRSPSFSREVESRTIMNSPLPFLPQGGDEEIKDQSRVKS